MKTKPPPRKPPPFLPPGCEALLSRQQIYAAIGVSERTLSGMLSAGEFPRRDTMVNKRARWKVSTLNEWIRRKCEEKE